MIIHSCTLQGKRDYQEDRYFIRNRLHKYTLVDNNVSESENLSNFPIDVLGIFDGHGGHHISDTLSKILPRYFYKQNIFQDNMPKPHQTYTDYIKPCDLVSHHVHNCEICRKNLIKSLENFEQKQETYNKIENFIPNTNIIETYNSFDLNESFENISPSQKNLLIVILYGILIILISDLIIKEE